MPPTKGVLCNYFLAGEKQFKQNTLPWLHNISKQIISRFRTAALRTFYLYMSQSSMNQKSLLEHLNRAINDHFKLQCELREFRTGGHHKVGP